jgi:hypothetical protein
MSSHQIEETRPTMQYTEVSATNPETILFMNRAAILSGNYINHRY